MNKISKLLGLTLAAAALFLTACSKKPIRPNPSTTAMGPSTTGPLEPTQISDLTTDVGSGLDARGTGEITPGSLSVVEPVYFGLDRAAVAAGERSKLEAAAKWLQDNPTKNLVLVGHCDWRGTSEYNLGLGDRRSTAVKDYLAYLGVSASRVETLSKGSTEAKQGGTDAEWAKDRRVDFIELTK
ncbi:OmpA family protein [Oleiharenicola lentus]|uniref:OmpA family protein n=1 Tax=Oleiharenicola lentus TaxID=2508720 RepID=UPI003F6809DD